MQWQKINFEKKKKKTKKVFWQRKKKTKKKVILKRKGYKLCTIFFRQRVGMGNMGLESLKKKKKLENFINSSY